MKDMSFQTNFVVLCKYNMSIELVAVCDSFVGQSVYFYWAALISLLLLLAQANKVADTLFDIASL